MVNYIFCENKYCTERDIIDKFAKLITGIYFKLFSVNRLDFFSQITKKSDSSLGNSSKRVVLLGRGLTFFYFPALFGTTKDRFKVIFQYFSTEY